GIRAFHVTGVQTCALPILVYRRGVVGDHVDRLAQRADDEVGPGLVVVGGGGGGGQAGVVVQDRPHARRLAGFDVAGGVAHQPARAEERRVGNVDRYGRAAT